MLRPDRLRTAREKRGLTQRDLGRLCGLGVNQINRYEQGVSDPGSAILTTIARELSVSTDYLVGLTDDPHDFSSTALREDELALLHAYSSGDSVTLLRLIADRMQKLTKATDATDE